MADRYLFRHGAKTRLHIDWLPDRCRLVSLSFSKTASPEQDSAGIATGLAIPIAWPRFRFVINEIRSRPAPWASSRLGGPEQVRNRAFSIPCKAVLRFVAGCGAQACIPVASAATDRIALRIPLSLPSDGGRTGCAAKSRRGFHLAVQVRRGRVASIPVTNYSRVWNMPLPPLAMQFRHAHQYREA